jgi:hypothetical protein
MLLESLMQRKRDIGRRGWARRRGVGFPSESTVVGTG